MSMTNINSIKGFSDFTGPTALKRSMIKSIFESEFELFGYGPTETPIIENEDFVTGGNSSDEAVRDTYKLRDRGKRNLALRYEFTFQLKRLAKNQKLPFKRYQIGPNFRDEPIRRGRLRQFIQADIDVIGSSIKDEAELLKITSNIFEKLQIPIKIFVNNRRLLNEILVSENVEEKNREQVIRELDKLGKLSKKQVADNLKKLGCEKIIEIFDGEEKSFEKYNFYSEIKELKECCKNYDVEVNFKPFLARGLSYYNGSIFEVTSPNLDVSLCGGGSYEVSGIQSTGISFGLEPIMILSPLDGTSTTLQLISIEQDKKTINLAEKLRLKGIKTNVILDKTLKKAMEYANAQNISYVVIIGKEEVENKIFKLKDMKTGKETKVSEKDLIKKLSS